MEKVQKYSAKLTGESFLLQELKIVAKLKKEGYEDKEIRNMILNENLFQYKFKSSISRRITPLMQRIKLLDDKLIDMLLENSLEDGRIINLYAIMKNDRLFFEFMDEVISKKFEANNEILEKKDINIFFEAKQEQNEEVAKWSEATVAKVKQVIRKILIEAKVIEDIKSGSVHKIIISNRVKEHLLKLGEEKYILAMGEKL
ncbi:DUF1819 family protein [Clostridium paraputrificum]|uniref:DUF1819 family protein n=1 Tax=Clostridium paraputrificum TaxID=29363 RepID=UPI003D358ECC